MSARLHVAPSLTGSGPDLDDDLTDEERHGTGHVVSVREECSVAGIRLPFGLDPAHREDHLVGAAGKEIPAARPSVDE